MATNGIVTSGSTLTWVYLASGPHKAMAVAAVADGTVRAVTFDPKFEIAPGQKAGTWLLQVEHFPEGVDAASAAPGVVPCTCQLPADKVEHAAECATRRQRLPTLEEVYEATRECVPDNQILQLLIMPGIMTRPRSFVQLASLGIVQAPPRAMKLT